MESSINSVVVTPIPAYGLWALLIASAVFLCWLTFTKQGKKLVAGIVDVAYVGLLISGIWVMVVATVAWVFNASFSLASLFV